jgi:hypothetical protein
VVSRQAESAQGLQRRVEHVSNTFLRTVTATVQYTGYRSEPHPFATYSAPVVASGFELLGAVLGISDALVTTGGTQHVITS